MLRLLLTSPGMIRPSPEPRPKLDFAPLLSTPGASDPFDTADDPEFSSSPIHHRVEGWSRAWLCIALHRTPIVTLTFPIPSLPARGERPGSARHSVRSCRGFRCW